MITGIVLAEGGGGVLWEQSILDFPKWHENMIKKVRQRQHRDTRTNTMIAIKKGSKAGDRAWFLGDGYVAYAK
ncbi:hypothetical protein [Endozoicomonas sp. GU-1]|uniref:hypothetical protein n=1 Tax=Endozoicomonas sp. GU-1 TaxID=3009078 RepID=UPI0022B2D8CB|nr:hypothetical protein [Endozoicomonas sp. GU-1]WBA81315.1 hypothetical protein O2T12_24010 [Endozoicomonas sp. GU-1]WBA84262.1 hypothetical protein O3276_13185 [Endozoicomonas sp. GU-1]